MNPLLASKLALITGAGAGIGAAAAEVYASEGAAVLVVDIDSGASDQVAKRIVTEGGTATALTVDVRELTQVEQLRDRVLDQHGPVDVLVNNVGHWVQLPASFADSSPDHWQALYEVNFLHVLQVTHAFLPSMLDRANGTIINVSSIEGLRGYPPDSVYGAFKAAATHFTQCLGVELAGKGIKVNGIAPDLTQTKQSDFERFDPPELRDKWPAFLPVGRMGQPLDQARVLLFLASELSDFLVGHTIPTDGGTGAAGGWFPSSRRKGRSWTNRPFDP
jgi:NAD(P)-dependent dehydrogenase (short-subunit alcohol dehydrogenase family)